MNDLLEDTDWVVTAEAHPLDPLDRRPAPGCGSTLESRLLASVHWITRHLPLFNAERDAEPGDVNVKALGELALSYAWIHGWKHRLGSIAAALDDPMERWLAFAARQCESAVYAEKPRKQPALGCLLLFAYLCLRSTGYRWTYHEGTLRFMHRRGYPAASEALPYRVLDRQYILWRSGWSTREPAWASLYRRTCLGRARGPLYLDYVSAYSVTHTILYLTDFGHRPPAITQSELGRIRDVVEYLLIHYWRLGNWDLVGELLINLECLGITNSSLYAECAAAFQAAWLEDGAVSPDAAGSYASKWIDTPQQAAARFKRYYHTTLVGALYCAVTLGRQQS
jgi:hypothetical protein